MGLENKVGPKNKVRPENPVGPGNKAGPPISICILYKIYVHIYSPLASPYCLSPDVAWCLLLVSLLPCLPSPAPAVLACMAAVLAAPVILAVPAGL